MARDNAREITFKELGDWLSRNGNSPNQQLFIHLNKRTPESYEEKKRERIKRDGVHPLLDCIVCNI